MVKMAGSQFLMVDDPGRLTAPRTSQARSDSSRCLRNLPQIATFSIGTSTEEIDMNGVIYLVGLVVVVMFVLSVLGLR